MQDINFVKAKAVAAAEFLGRYNVEVQNAIILELLSRLEGFRNWSAFREQLVVTPAVSDPPTVQQALTMCYRWMSSAPIEALEAVEKALGENAPVRMAAEALKAASTPQSAPGPQAAAAQWSPVMGAMTDGQYIGRKGCRCPSCGSYNVVSRGSAQIDNGNAYQNVKCEKCDAEWSDSYALNGYCELEGGIDLGRVSTVVEDVKRRASQGGFSIAGEAKNQEEIKESWAELIGGQPNEAEMEVAVMQLTS